MNEKVNHPPHYGGESNPYEAIKVIEAWELNFNLGNAVKYLCRQGKKDQDYAVQDLEKALWYLQREIGLRKKMSYSSSTFASAGAPEKSESNLGEAETPVSPEPTSSTPPGISALRRSHATPEEALEGALIRVENYATGNLILSLSRVVKVYRCEGTETTLPPVYCILVEWIK